MLGFSENIPKLEARRMLREVKLGHVQMTPDGMLSLLEAELGDPEAAQRIVSAWAFAKEVAAAQEGGG